MATPYLFVKELDNAKHYLQEFFQRLLWVAESCMAACFSTQFLSMVLFWLIFHKVV